jgi:hypothetical protein
VYHPQRGWLRARNIAGADEGDQTFLCQLRVE